MSEKSLDQNIFPEMLGTARCVRWPRAIERIELFPAPRGMFFSLNGSNII